MTDHDCLIVAGCMQLSELQSKGDIYNSLNKTEAGGQQQDITCYLKANMNRSKKLCPIKSEKHFADQVWSQNISGPPGLIDVFAAVVWFFLECINCSSVSIQVIQVRGTPKSGYGMLWHVVATRACSLQHKDFGILAWRSFRSPCRWPVCLRKKTHRDFCFLACSSVCQNVSMCVCVCQSCWILIPSGFWKAMLHSSQSTNFCHGT